MELSPITQEEKERNN